MADVNKKSLAELLNEKKPELKLSKKAANEIIDLIFDEIAKDVKEGKKVDVSGFGKFVLKERKARTGINPATKQTIQIPASRVPGFKPAKAFKELVK